MSIIHIKKIALYKRNDFYNWHFHCDKYKNVWK